MPARHPIRPTAAVTRRTRNGSNLQSAIAIGMNTIAAMIEAVRTLGNIIARNAIVSASMIMTSMKLNDIQSTSYLKRDTMISTTNSTSVSAAASAGRRSSVSHRKFRQPQVNANTAADNRSISLQSMIASAARWNSASGATRTSQCCPSASRSGTRPGRVGSRIVIVASFVASRLSEPFDHPGIDQHAIETSRLSTTITVEEKSVATLHDLLLLLERGVERQARILEHNKRQIRAFDGVERGGHGGRF